MAVLHRKRIKEPLGDRVLQIVTILLLLAVIIIVGYPVVYTISCSFSSASAISSGRVVFLPVKITLSGYKFVAQYKQVFTGYRNTIFYTFFGTLITMFLTIGCAYPLSKSKFQGRSRYTAYFLLTTLFGAGLIPTYLVKAKMGMVDSVWAVLLSSSLSFHNMVILRTAFKSSIPSDLFDAAEIDGANDFQSLFKIALPLAKATISVITLYSIVGCWNEYFTSMIYLRKMEMWPLQLFLRTILTSSASLDMSGVSASMMEMANEGIEQIRYCLIVISTVPVLVAYAVVQKYFKKGVMIGSVKG